MFLQLGSAELKVFAANKLPTSPSVSTSLYSPFHGAVALIPSDKSPHSDIHTTPQRHVPSHCLNSFLHSETLSTAGLTISASAKEQRGVNEILPPGLCRFYNTHVELNNLCSNMPYVAACYFLPLT